MTIGEDLKAERKRLGLSQSQMTGNLITKSHYSKIERGLFDIRTNDLLTILNLHNIDVVEFFKKISVTNQEENTKAYLAQLHAAYYTRNIEKIEQISNKLKNKQPKTLELKNLEAQYNEAKKKYKLPYSFEETLLMLDYIYCVDLIAYKDNPDKETILSGKETESFYQIYPEKGYKLSQQTQKGYINSFDVDNFLALVDSGGNYKEFGRLVIDCEKRKIISQFIEPLSGKDQGNTHKRS